MAEEVVYYNYSLDDGLLNDYRYLGSNFEDRERIRMKIKRWVDGLERLEPRERMAIVSAVIHRNRDVGHPTC